MTTLERRKPDFDEVLAALESIRKTEDSHCRNAERLEITIPGEIITKDGQTIPIRLRDVSVSGIGFFHYGSIACGEVTLKLAVNSYLVNVKWCIRCANDLFMSGGPILRKFVPQSRTSTSESFRSIRPRRS